MSSLVESVLEEVVVVFDDSGLIVVDFEASPISVKPLSHPIVSIKNKNKKIT